MCILNVHQSQDRVPFQITLNSLGVAMQKVIRSLNSILCVLAVSSTTTVAATGGVIHFVGQIVETPCAYQASSRQVHVKCYNDKIGNTEQAFPIAALLKGGVISNDKSTARLQWVDRTKNLAILNVEYK